MNLEAQKMPSIRFSSPPLEISSSPVDVPSSPPVSRGPWRRGQARNNDESPPYCPSPPRPGSLPPQTRPSVREANPLRRKRSTRQDSTESLDPAPQSTSVEDGKAARRRREKPQLSCNLCRKRKLRCDRRQPCHNCAHRGMATTCAYVHSSPPMSSSSRSPTLLPASTVRDRVRQLEDQVVRLMGALNDASMPAQAGAGAATSSPKLCPGNSNGGPTISDPPGASFPEAPGHMDYRTSSINYVGNGHWLSMLENIPELSEVLRERKQDFVAAQTSMSRIPNLLSGSFQQTDRAEILAAIPSRNIVDTLISEAFVNTDNECMIVHPPTFRKEYMQFWADPASTPIMWIGLLFTLMCLAIQYQQFSPDESRRLQIADANPDQLVATFHMKAAQCLFLGRYLEGPKYTVETLLLHLFAEHLEGDHTETTNSCWALWGLIVRIALRSGYHRDGSHFPSISPFEAELRRRTWAIIIQWDNFLSTQFCLPRMIVQSQSDTAEPRNLMEEDFDNNMLELPPARPVSAKTNAQFHTDKNRLLSVAGAIADLSGALRPPPIAEVLRLDDLLTETYESVAPLWQSDGAVVAAQTARYTQRASGSVRSIFLASIYCRAQITLHQRYLVPGKTIAQYARSRKTCIDAALTMLQHQWTLYLETQVGGPLCRHGWKFLSLLTQDFLFATALLCAELALDLGGDASSGFGSGSASSAEEFRRQISEDAEETRSRVFHSLSSAYIVWLQSRNYDSSRAVRTMVAALKELLRRAQGAGYAATKAPSSATVRRVQSQGHASTMATPDSLQDPGRWGGPSESYHSIALFPI